MDTKQKLKNLLQKNNLSEKDLNEWSLLIDSLPEESLEELFEAIEAFPEEIAWINNIFTKKSEAFSILESDNKKGQELLKQIENEEKDKLKELLNK